MRDSRLQYQYNLFTHNLCFNSLVYIRTVIRFVPLTYIVLYRVHMQHIERCGSTWRVPDSPRDKPDKSESRK